MLPQPWYAYHLLPQPSFPPLTISHFQTWKIKWVGGKKKDIFRQRSNRGARHKVLFGGVKILKNRWMKCMKLKGHYVERCNVCFLCKNLCIIQKSKKLLTHPRIVANRVPLRSWIILNNEVNPLKDSRVFHFLEEKLEYFLKNSINIFKIIFLYLQIISFVFCIFLLLSCSWIIYLLGETKICANLLESFQWFTKEIKTRKTCI